MLLQAGESTGMTRPGVGWRPTLASLSALLFFIFGSFLHGQGIRLEEDLAGPIAGVPRIYSEGQSNSVHQVQGTADFLVWRDIATVHDGPFDLADWEALGSERQFYRAMSRVRTGNDDGKNQILFPDDSFVSPPTGNLDDCRWVKFAIVLDQPGRIWFQDSGKYLFHYDWAVKRLARFAGLSRAQFDAISLHTNQQQIVLGAILFPPYDFLGRVTREYGIQFVGLDPYPAEVLVRWYRWVQTAVYQRTQASVFYMPTFEQQSIARDQRAVLESQGLKISDVNRWLSGDICYSDGWAIGRLVYIPADEIATAYTEGRLKPSDILFTDGIPAEIPFVAGVVTTAAATPNSHVAILARSYRIPFAFVADASRQANLQTWVGKEVLLRTEGSTYYTVVTVSPVDADLAPELQAQLAALKSVGELVFPPKAHLGAISTNLDLVTAADIRFVGGKAGNFGVLRRSIPSNSPPALALTFDLWDAFLDQTLPNSSKTLREEIRSRTAGFSYPPNMRAVQETLTGIRELIRKDARFSAPLQQGIIKALEGFDPKRKIRFRSSTNVEDGEQFTGAGLYDSYSGCLADDLDADATGPCQCDPLELDERGVFRAIQRVYASFYNENAWLERLRFGLDEDQAGVAVLVHHSFPDEDELANGVATLMVDRSAGWLNYSLELVTQLGAVSVSNPDGGATPEVVEGNLYQNHSYLDTRKRSSLVPLGGNVMVWNGDYQALLALIDKAVAGYVQMTGKPSLSLDLEYKKVRSGHLEIKQIREIPRPKAGTMITAFLLNEPARYWIEQGEMGDVFGIHRLKGRLRLETSNLRLATTNLTRSFYRAAEMEFVSGTNTVTLSGGFGAWPEASFSFNAGVANDSWTVAIEKESRRYRLQTTVTREVDSTANPVFTQRDFAKYLTVDYTTPQPVLAYEGPGTSTNDAARLAPEQAITSKSLLQSRSTKSKSGWGLDTSFYWPEMPRGPTAGYTAPLIGWVETRITGVTSEPIILKGYYSQTYHPGHHNFFEQFLFEPQLEPGMAASQLAELASQNIRFIAVELWQGTMNGWFVGFDGEFRRAD